MTDEDDITTTKMMTTHATDKHFIIRGHYSIFWDDLHRADNSLCEKRNLTPIKTEMTIIMTDEDDITTTKMMTTHATDKHFIIDVKFMTNALRNVLLSYTKKNDMSCW